MAWRDGDGGWREEEEGYMYIYDVIITYMCVLHLLYTYYIISMINEHAKFKKIELTAASPQINSSSASFSL